MKKELNTDIKAETKTAVGTSFFLKSMTDFILEKNDKIMNTKYNDGALTYMDAQKFVNYAKFLKQPLKLWMFVPCELVGNKFANWQPIEEIDCDLDIKIDEVKKYQQAKERCLFKGFEFVNKLEKALVLKYKKDTYWIPRQDTIEGLMFNFIPDDVELTETAIKQLGL